MSKVRRQSDKICKYRNNFHVTPGFLLARVYPYSHIHRSRNSVHPSISQGYRASGTPGPKALCSPVNTRRHWHDRTHWTWGSINEAPMSSTDEQPDRGATCRLTWWCGSRCSIFCELSDRMVSEDFQTLKSYEDSLWLQALSFPRSTNLHASA